MQNWDKVNLIVLVLVLLIPLSGEVLLIYKYGSYIAGDAVLHHRLTEELLQLKYPGNSLYPYPPGLHLLLAFLSIVFLSSPLQVITAIKPIILLVAVLSTAYFVFKKSGLFTAIILVFLLLSSPAFWDRSSQINPQAFDLMLIPLAYYFFLEKKNRTFIAISTFLVYNHFAYAILPLGGLFAYSIFNQRRFREFRVIVLLSLPLIIFMMLNISPILVESTSVQTLQEDAVLREPLFIIKYLGYPLFILIFIIVIRQKFGGSTPLKKISQYWALSLLPMIIYFPDRFIEYVSQPLAVMGAIAINELVKSDREREVIVLGLFIFTLASLFAFYKALLTTGGVLLPLDTLSPFAV